MFDNIPKVRPPLPQEIRDIYVRHYQANRNGETFASSIAQRMESWLHRHVARDVANRPDAGKSTLELGAGTLNQLRYEPAAPVYDIVEPFTDLYQDSPLLSRVRNIYTDIADVPDRYRYDRITAVATLEHVCNLPDLVARSGLLLAGEGVFRASIPSEGTWLWTLGWTLTTGLEFKLKYGLDYGLLLKHEHVNSAQEIEDVLSYFFQDMTCRVFGLSKSISFYRYYECRLPHLDKCRAFLSRPST